MRMNVKLEVGSTHDGFTIKDVIVFFEDIHKNVALSWQPVTKSLSFIRVISIEEIPERVQ